jgi:hypothetical protein
LLTKQRIAAGVLRAIKDGRVKADNFKGHHHTSAALETQKKAILYISGQYRSRNTVTPASQELHTALDQEIIRAEGLIKIFSDSPLRE